jgi:hypothetical protein
VYILKSGLKQIRFISALMLIAGFCCANAYSAEKAASNIPLRAKYIELTKQLNNNQFKRALYLNSTESSHDLKGEIYAVVDYPFATVNQALNNPAHWCDVLILHINIKYCHADENKTGTTLTVNLGKKNAQPLADTYRVNFSYREIITTADYFAVELYAENGPLNTRDYRIWVEATPIKGGRTFLHFTYAYAFGLAGRVAMQGYLATIGSDKVGFTVTGKLADGNPNYIKGVRGVVERNTMRYYLAIDAYLSELNAPASQQLERRLKSWYRSTEQYPRQLHEVELNEYLAMKREEYERQQAVH